MRGIILSILLVFAIPIWGQNPVETTGRGKYRVTGKGSYRTQSPYVAPSTPPEVPTWTNLVSWWKMTETSGGTAEDSEGSDDGTVIGGTQTSTGIVFDGANDSVAVTGTAFGTGDFTIVMRINPTTTDPIRQENLISSTDGNFELQILWGTAVYLRCGASYVYTTDLLTDGAVNFLSVVRDGTNFRFCVNGFFETDVMSADFTSAFTTIGAGGANDFTGTVRDLCYFSDAKCDDYITAFYNSGSYTDYEDGDPSSCGDTAQAYQDFMDSATVVMYATWENVDTAFHLSKADVELAYHNAAIGTYAFNGFMETANALDSTNYCIDDGNNKFHRVFQAEDQVDVIGYVGDTSGSGFMYHLELPGDHDTLYVTTNFRWHNTEGDTIYNSRYDAGKIVPGFYANHYDYAGEGNYDGFSLGNSFRDTLYGSPSYDMHGLSSYLYWGGQSQPYGDVSLCTDPDTGDPIVFDSYWHNFTWFVAMNDPGSANGVIRGFFDGRLVKEITGLTLREFGTRHIEWLKMYFTFGGDTWDQRSYKEHWLDIDETYIFYYDYEVKTDYLTLPNWDIANDKPIFNGVLTENEAGTIEGEDNNPD